jgi:cytoskeletal protein CcmA (bactofilin family)
MALPHEEIGAGAPPLLWSEVQKALDKINDNFTALDLATGGDAVDLTTLGSSIIPRTTETFDLGSASKKWRDLYLSGSSLYIGDAVITATDTTINLPAGSTIGGNILDQAYFKTVVVAGQSNIVAEPGGDDTLNLSASTGIAITTNADTGTITFTNTGVTGILTSTGIGASTETGAVTLTNTGVTSIVAGFGMSVNSATGIVTVTNEGLAGLDAGLGITISARDPLTGKITVTNNQPNVPQNTFRSVAVPGQSTILSESTADTLTIEKLGDGLSITTNTISRTVTVSNTGVHSLTVGTGLTASAGTGSINLSLDSVLNRDVVGNVTGDLNGSVFSDDSIMLIDSTNGVIVGPVNTTTVEASGTIEGNIVEAVTSVRTPELVTSLIDSQDSSAITITPKTIFSSDVDVENDINITGGRLFGRVNAVDQLLANIKAAAATSADFDEFKSAIANL